ncbi:MAG TPA: hypothetical protein VFZ36_01650 [Vicinamibacterales bacterium]
MRAITPRAGTLRGLLLAASLMTAAACGGSPAAPDPAAQFAGQLRVVLDGGGAVKTLPAGESAAPTLEDRDAAGRIVTQAPSSYVWSSSDPDIVRAGAGGTLTAGPGLGHAVVTARAQDGRTATAHVWVQPPQGAPSAYRITLMYDASVPDVWRMEFDAAAARWEQVIRGALPEAPLVKSAPGVCGTVEGDPPEPPLSGIERGTRIWIRVTDSFDTSPYPEAVGGPCQHRPLPSPTVIFGRIAINGKVSIGQISLPRRRYLALHEMGHALGLAAVIQGPQPAWFDARADRHMGPMALEGYRRDSGVNVPHIQMGAGHWQALPKADVMGGIFQRISPVSAGGLMDIGYPAAWYGADE